MKYIKIILMIFTILSSILFLLSANVENNTVETLDKTIREYMIDKSERGLREVMTMNIYRYEYRMYKLEVIDEINWFIQLAKNKSSNSTGDTIFIKKYVCDSTVEVCYPYYLKLPDGICNFYPPILYLFKSDNFKKTLWAKDVINNVNRLYRIFKEMNVICDYTMRRVGTTSSDFFLDRLSIHRVNDERHYFIKWSNGERYYSDDIQIYSKNKDQTILFEGFEYPYSEAVDLFKEIRIQKLYNHPNGIDTVQYYFKPEWVYLKERTKKISLKIHNEVTGEDDIFLY